MAIFVQLKKIILFGLDAIITNNPNDIEKADNLILPGVGNFSNVMNKLETLWFNRGS